MSDQADKTKTLTTFIAEELQAGLAKLPIPGHMHGAIRRYVLSGHPVGGFLTALLTNDLHGTFTHADDLNAAHVQDWLKLLYNFTPAACWGSQKRVDEWQAHMGAAHAKERRNDTRRTFSLVQEARARIFR